MQFHIPGSGQRQRQRPENTDQSPNNITVNVAAVNDPPVISYAGPTTAIVAENTSLVFGSGTGNLLSISDVDVTPTDIVQATLGVLHGTLSLSGITGITVTAGANGSTGMTIQGTLSAIDAALNGLAYQGSHDFLGSDTLSISTSDLGHNGSGGAQTASASVAISVDPPQQAPVVTSATNGSLGAVGNSSQLFNGDFDNATPLTGWSLTGVTGTAGLSPVFVDQNNAFVVGVFNPFATSTSNATLSHSVSTGNGVAYTLDFALTNGGEGTSPNDMLTVLWDDAPVATFTANQLTNFFQHYHVTVIGTGSDTLQFATADTTKNVLWDLDTVTLTPVTTPTTDTTTGTIKFTDGNSSDTHSVSVVTNSNIGTFTASLGAEPSGGNPGTVNWNYTVNESAIQFLAAGQQLVQTYTVNIDDHHGGITPQTITVTLTGANDAPVTNTETIITNVGKNASFSFPDWALLANDTDPDNGTTLSLYGIGFNGVNGLGNNSDSGGIVTTTDDGTLGGTIGYSPGDGFGPGNGVQDNFTNQVAGSSITGSSGDDIIVNGVTTGVALGGGAGNDVVFGNSGNDSLTGGTGADILTGGAGIDTFHYIGGDTAITIGGSGDNGTIKGYDVITDFTPTADILDLVGNPPGAAADTTGTHVNNSALTIGGLQISSHAISNGVITFSTSAVFGTALSLTTTAGVAAAVDYLEHNNIGAGKVVAFTATINGTVHTYVFEQIGAAPNPLNDILVDLSG